MAYEKTEIHERDYRSVYMGSVHNIGAGGVDADCALGYLISDKREKQYLKRTDRAVGDLENE